MESFIDYFLKKNYLHENRSDSRESWSHACPLPLPSATTLKRNTFKRISWAQCQLACWAPLMFQNFLPAFHSQQRICTGSGLFTQPTCSPATPIVGLRLWCTAPFLTHSLAFWTEVGGNFQGRREDDNEDPEVFCFGQAAAFLHFRSTQEISQKAAASDSQGVKGELNVPSQLRYLVEWKLRASTFSPGGTTCPIPGLWIWAVPLDSSHCFLSVLHFRAWWPFPPCRDPGQIPFLSPFPGQTQLQ